MSEAAAREMRRLNRALRTLSAGNHALLHAAEEGALLREMCRVIVEEGGYRWAWVSYAQHDETKSIRPMAYAGLDEETVSRFQVRWADAERGRGPAGTALRTGKPCVGRRLLEDPGLAPWRESAVNEGVAAVSAFPLVQDGEAFGCLAMAAAEPDAFDEAEVRLLNEMAADLAYGIGVLRMRARHQAAEAELRRVNRALRTLGAGNRTLLHASEEPQLLCEMCRVIVEEGGYRMAWVGYAQHDPDKTLRPMAWAGHDAENFLASARFTWGECERGQGPAAVAVRTGKPCVGRATQTDPALAPWREASAERGYAAVSVFPLILEGQVLGNLSIDAAEPDAFDEAEVRLLGELADNLSYGIGTLRTRVRHREAQETIRRMAYHDALTGLPNRAALCELLEDAIRAARNQHRPLALLLLSVGHFREINDTLGYREGDRLLQEVGQRLARAVKEGENVARVGEDEFAILLPQGGADYGTQVARRLVAAFNEPVELSGLMVDARANIGIALFPGHGPDPEALIRRANAAMHQARQSPCGYAVYSGGLGEEGAQRLRLMTDLRRAIDNDELLLYCQPKVHIATNRVCGAEALVRWRHPQHGMISTGQFIKLAEHAGLITPLTYWVLEATFRQSHAWREAGLTWPLAVNLSARDLRDPRLLERIQGLFATWGTRPESIQFELTESALMEDPAGALDALTRLKNMGVELLVDDFGTGYSSLSYLQKLPVDTIKIDQSFVTDMAANADSATIVRSTIELGHSLDMEVVAEGVEDRAVWDRLAGLGCDAAQGYFISTPIPAAEFPGWESRSPWHGPG